MSLKLGQCKEEKIFHRDDDMVGIGGRRCVQSFSLDSFFGNDGGSLYEEGFAAVGGETVLDKVEETKSVSAAHLQKAWWEKSLTVH